jgi:hypothetical protein
MNGADAGLIRRERVRKRGLEPDEPDEQSTEACAHIGKRRNKHPSANPTRRQELGEVLDHSDAVTDITARSRQSVSSDAQGTGATS